MFVFILRRLLLMIPTTLGVTGVVFLIFQAAPGDPATVMLGMGGGGEMGGKSDFAARKQAFEVKYGLDRTWAVQFLDYVGPFNLSRDGHPWFSSPYSEREVDRVTLDDGTEAVFGKPLRIPFPPHVAENGRAALDRSARTLADSAAEADARDAAAEELAAAGNVAWSPVLSALLRQETRLDDLETLRRLDALCGRLVEISVDGSSAERLSFAGILEDSERDPIELIRSWFGWYHTALDQSARTLADPAAEADARDAAAEELAVAGSVAWSPVLSALQRQELRLDDLETLRRLDALCGRLVEITAGDSNAGRLSFAGILEDPAREPIELIQSWFGWYYTAGGGDRVRNSGEDKWGGLVLLDLGNEIQSGRNVRDELWTRLKVTVPLSVIAVLISYLIALPLGIFSARRQGSFTDTVITVLLFILYSVPTFWAGLMLIRAFGVTGFDWWWWPRLPVLGLHDADADTLGFFAYAWDYILHIILPVATLSYGGFAYISRLMRSGMLDVIRQDYIRTARAKGLSDNVVVYKHTLRNSLIPVITLFASVLPILIGGSVIVEKIFSIPGMGLYAFDGLLRRDFNIIMATTIFVGVLTQIGILISDIVYSLVDPRIRHD